MAVTHWVLTLREPEEHVHTRKKSKATPACALLVSTPGGYLLEAKFSRKMKLIIFHSWRKKTQCIKNYKAAQSGMHFFSSHGEMNSSFGEYHFEPKNWSHLDTFTAGGCQGLVGDGDTWHGLDREPVLSLCCDHTVSAAMFTALGTGILASSRGLSLIAVP